MVVKPQERKYILISGVFVTISMFIAAVFIFLLGNENSLFSSKIEIKTVVSNAQNLKTGAAVQLKGVRIGTVREMQFIEIDKLQLILSVEASYQSWIKQDSYIAFKTQGVLGDRYLEILGGTNESAPIKNHDFLRIEESSMLDKFLSQGEDMAQVVTRVLHKVDNFIDSFPPSKINSILNNIDDTTKNASKAFDGIDGKKIDRILTNAEKVTAKLGNASDNFNSIVERVQKGPGTLHSLVHDRSVYDDLQEILGGTKRNKVLRYFIQQSIQSNDGSEVKN